jgi:hypothetical protein
LQCGQDGRSESDVQQLVDSFNELNIEFTIQTILYGSETSDYNQNVKLLRAVHSFIKRTKRFDNKGKMVGQKVMLLQM